MARRKYEATPRSRTAIAGRKARTAFLIAATALGALLAGCVDGPPDFVPVAEEHTVRVPDELPIAEATFRYMFRHNASGQQQRASVYCLSFTTIGEKSWIENDPPADFIARFSDVAIPVKPASGCMKGPGLEVVDRATGKGGLQFRIEAISCTSPDDCTVNGGYSEAGLSASGNIYTLKRQDGQWQVIHNEMRWIA